MISTKMAQDAVQDCLDRFAKIYYFFPLLPERTVKKIKLDREVYAILWLCATLIEERDDDFCLQQEAQKVFRWWNPNHTKKLTKNKPDTHFTKLMNALENSGYVNKIVHKANKRMKEIRVTSKGYKLLNDIKKQREKSIQSLFRLVTNQKQVEQVLITLDAIADYTWESMKTYRASSGLKKR